MATRKTRTPRKYIDPYYCRDCKQVATDACCLEFNAWINTIGYDATVKAIASGKTPTFGK